MISHLAPFNCTFSVQGRLKMDPTSGLGRCVSLVVYLNEDEARTCVKNQQVGSNRRLKVNKRLITISNKLLLQLVLLLPFSKP